MSVKFEQNVLSSHHPYPIRETMMPASTLTESLFAFGLDLTLRVTIVLGITCLLAVMLRQASAATRRLLWAGGLTTVLVLPGLMLVGPRVSVALPRLQVATSPAHPRPTESGESVGVRVGQRATASSAPATASVPAARVEEPTPASRAVGAEPMRAAGRSRAGNPLTLLVVLVAACVGWRLSLVVVSLLRARHLQRRSKPIESADWLSDWARCKQSIGVSRAVSLRETDAAVAPLACGTLKSSVLFPRWARDWSGARRRAAMLHELAHVRHADVLVLLLSQIAGALYFFHPLVWLAMRQLRHECERTCDDRVLAAGYRATDYASHLTGIARALSGRRPQTALTLAITKSSNIQKRIRAILNPTERRGRPVRGSGVLMLLGAACVGLALAAPQSTEPLAKDNLEAVGLGATTQSRNRVFATEKAPVAWNISTGKNVRWKRPLGSQTYGSPVVDAGRVFIGTNNAGGRVERLGKNTDMGCLLAFDAESGAFLWQYAAKKLATGRVNDWPRSGITASPYADAGRVYLVNNRSEVVCLDAEGFRDNENDGVVQSEVVALEEADVIWNTDLIEELGSFPHNHSDCTITSDGKTLFIVVPNGVDQTHQKLPAADTPAFVALDRNTGDIVWTSNVDSRGIMHAQWSSAALVTVGGRTQVLCPGGDGWLYGIDATDGSTIWQFNCNPAGATWQAGGRGRRNNLIGMPMVYNGLVYVATGQDPEHGEGEGDLWCIAPDGRGDVSPQIVQGSRRVDNPQSKVVWHVGDGDFGRSVSTPAAKDGLLIVPELAGRVHCFDTKTGKRHWEHDLLAACWSSPVIVNDHVLVADEDGEVTVLPLSTQKGAAVDLDLDRAVYGTPTVAQNRLFIASARTLFAFEEGASGDKAVAAASGSQRVR